MQTEVEVILGAISDGSFQGDQDKVIDAIGAAFANFDRSPEETIAQVNEALRLQGRHSRLKLRKPVWAEDQYQGRPASKFAAELLLIKHGAVIDRMQVDFTPLND